MVELLILKVIFLDLGDIKEGPHYFAYPLEFFVSQLKSNDISF